MMKNGLDVFDFKEEDELPEKLDGQILEKFKYPKNNNPDDHLLKYKVLECVAQESYVRKEVGNVPCVDVDAIDCDQSFEDAHTSKQDDAFTEITQGMVEEDFASKEESIGLDVSTQWNSMAAEETPTVNEDNEKFENCHLESGNSCLQNGLIDITSGADECTNESLPSSPTSETAEDGIFLDGDSSHHCSNDFEMDDVVVLLPDYVEYLDSHYLEPIISFSCTGIKITDSTGDTPFSFQTGIDDILDIHCHYFESVSCNNHRWNGCI
jgi:sentrin-specific protease 7